MLYFRLFYRMNPKPRGHRSVTFGSGRVWDWLAGFPLGCSWLAAAPSLPPVLGDLSPFVFSPLVVAAPFGSPLAVLVASFPCSSSASSPGNTLGLNTYNSARSAAVKCRSIWCWSTTRWDRDSFVTWWRRRIRASQNGSLVSNSTSTFLPKPWITSSMTRRDVTWRTTRARFKESLTPGRYVNK